MLRPVVEVEVITIMSEDGPNWPRRKKIRIEAFDYSAAGTYFVTVCTMNRKPIFWSGVGADIIRPPMRVPLSREGAIVQQSILQISERYESVHVDTYCVMPDHIHLLIRIGGHEPGRIISAPTLSTVIGSMKRWTSRHIGYPIWQKSFYDHAIRNQQDYNDIWEYIERNPLKYAEEGTGCRLE